MNIRFCRLPKFLLPAFILAVGCSRPSEKGTDESVMDTGVGVAETEDTVSKEPERVVLKFASSQEALEYMRESGDWDKYSRGIIPTMASEELDYAEKLLNNEYDRFIVVDKASMKVILYSRYGEVLKKYGMACAKNYGTKHRKADSRTPEGFFTAEGIYDSTDWLFTDDNGVTSPKKGQFGPRFVRLKCPNTSQIGIHGTVAPWSIGHRASHGCIRLTNENILELVEYVQIGMPIIVSPGPRDMAVNESEGFSIASITTLPGGKRAVPQKGYQVKAVADSDSVMSSEGSDTIQKMSPETLPETESDTVPESVAV